MTRDLYSEIYNFKRKGIKPPIGQKIEPYYVDENQEKLRIAKKMKKLGFSKKEIETRLNIRLKPGKQRAHDNRAKS